MSRELFRGFEPAFATEEELKAFRAQADFVSAALYVVNKLTSLLGSLAKARSDHDTA